MIVTLDEALFHAEVADDVALLSVICDGLGRYKVHTRPAYRPIDDNLVNRWVADQSARVQARARIVLEEGLKAPEYALERGAREPRLVVENRGEPEWPDSFDLGPARLPLSIARQLLARPLRLLLENGRNDWAFLAKVVPLAWKARWERAVAERWVEEHNAGGITEMRRIVEEQLAGDPVRRLRTWAMFDSDGQRTGDASQNSEDTRRACESWGVAHHRLVRRAIENYIPKAALFDWAWRRRPRAAQREKLSSVRAYFALPTDEERHYFDMKAGFHNQLAQHVWSDAELDAAGRTIVYTIEETALLGNGFGPEREALFQSLFSRL